MKYTSQLTALAASMLLIFGLSACDRHDSAAEKAGDKIEDSAEKAADKIEDAGDKIEDKVD